ncbi:MAG: hypothetical protein HY791_36815 [Deltaproteobacteria bacterium]|nr:hypothetical protein [Deltaproteobacteria bacterium]
MMAAGLEQKKSEELEARKSELEYLAQMQALEGLTPNPADTAEYQELKRELERRKKRQDKPR